MSDMIFWLLQIKLQLKIAQTCLSASDSIKSHAEQLILCNASFPHLNLTWQFISVLTILMSFLWSSWWCEIPCCLQAAAQSIYPHDAFSATLAVLICRNLSSSHQCVLFQKLAGCREIACQNWVQWNDDRVLSESARNVTENVCISLHVCTSI